MGLLFLLGLSFSSSAAPRWHETTIAGYNVTISVPVNGSIANGTDNDVIQVYVTDAVTGLPVDGVSVGFLISGTTVTTSLKTGPIGGFPTGTVLFPLASYQVGSTDVVITIGGVPVTGSPATVNFIAGPPSTSNPQTQLILDHSPETANGVNQDKVHLHIVDLYGNVEVNTAVTVVFTIVPNGDPAEGSAVLTPGATYTATGKTDASGNVDLIITDIKAGTVKIGATLNGSAVGNTVDAVFVADVPDVSRPGTMLVVDASRAIANGSATDMIHAHLVDANDNIVANQTVTMTFSVFPSGSADATAVLTYTATGTTDASGNVYLTITNTKTGTVQLVATVNGNPIVNGSPAPVVFIADVPDVTRPETALIVDNSPAVADGVATDKIHAHLVDANGNIVANQTVTMTFSVNPSGAADATAVLTYTATGMTDASGDVYLTITNTTVGTVQLVATVNGNSIVNGSPASVVFILPPPDPNPPAGSTDPSYYIVTTDNATADGTSQDVVKVHLTTGSVPVPNYAVTFTIFGGTASATALFNYNGTTTATTITISTDVNGDIVLPIVDTKVGDVIIIATITLTPSGPPISITGSPRTVHFVVGAPSANPPGNPTGGTTFWVSQDNAVADNIQQDSLKAHISDATGNAVGAGVEVDFTITGGAAAGKAYFQPANTQATIPMFTNATGDIAFAMTDIIAGGVIVKAVLVSTGEEIHNSPQTAHFIAGPAVPSAPLAPTGTGTWLSVTQDNRPADGKKVDSVLAHITDQYGNAVQNEPVTFTIIAGGSATAGALFQPGSVVTTITLNTDANGNIEAAISDIISGDVWVNASIVYGGVATLIDNSHVIAHFTEAPDVTNPETQLIVVIYQALSDGSSVTSVKAHVVDKAGNSLPGWDVTFAIDSGTATIITPQPVTTDANGDAIITLTSTKPGYVLITATVNGESITFGSPARVKFSPINIYVPRVFTPNGDGSNDQLKPILVGIATFHYFSVYNRWGNLIFTTEDPNRGWDGTFKGVPQPVETYLWIAEGIDVSGKTIVQKGMVSLVK